MLLFSFDRFSNGKFLKQCCHYAKLERRSTGWDVVFDQKTPRTEAIRAFKQKLSEAINDGSLSNMQSNPYIKDALDSLMQKFSISEGSFEKSVMSLYRLMLQQRIPDEGVYDVIARISSDYVINLAIPSSSELKNVTHYQEKPSLRIHPERKGHLEGIIKEIEGHRNVALRGKLFQEVKHEVSVRHSNIDVGCLQEYLHKAEHSKDHKRYAWEKTRPYNWDRNNVNESLRLNAGELIFSYGTRSPRRSSLSKLIKSSIKNRTHDNSYLQKSPKDILIYNLERRSKIVIPASHTNSIFNINYRDLFGIINGSGLAPDETLVIINQLEAEGWKLVGDLYDNSDNVVFQRTTGIGHKNKSAASYKIVIIPLMAILIGSGICYFH